MLHHALVINSPKFTRKQCCIDQPDCYSLAVSNGEVGGNFYGVCKRVSVVQQHSTTAFALICTNNVSLNLNASRNSRSEIKTQQVIAREEVILGHLSIAASRFARAQAGECVSVTQHSTWLPKRTDQILSLSKIHSGLTANCSIDHANQRCGHMHNGDTAMPSRSSKASNVCDHASPNPNNHIVSRKTKLRAFVHDHFDSCKRFEFFTRTNVDGAR